MVYTKSSLEIANFVQTRCMVCNRIRSIDKSVEEFSFYYENRDKLVKLLEKLNIVPFEIKNGRNFNCHDCKVLLEKVIKAWDVFKQLKKKLDDLKNILSDYRNNKVPKSADRPENEIKEVNGEKSDNDKSEKVKKDLKRRLSSSGSDETEDETEEKEESPPPPPIKIAKIDWSGGPDEELIEDIKFPSLADWEDSDLYKGEPVLELIELTESEIERIKNEIKEEWAGEYGNKRALRKKQQESEKKTEEDSDVQSTVSEKSSDSDSDSDFNKKVTKKPQTRQLGNKTSRKGKKKSKPKYYDSSDSEDEIAGRKSRRIKKIENVKRKSLRTLRNKKKSMAERSGSDFSDDDSEDDKRSLRPRKKVDTKVYKIDSDNSDSESEKKKKKKAKKGSDSDEFKADSNSDENEDEIEKESSDKEEKSSKKERKRGKKKNYSDSEQSDKDEKSNSESDENDKEKSPPRPKKKKLTDKKSKISKQSDEDEKSNSEDSDENDKEKSLLRSKKTNAKKSKISEQSDKDEKSNSEDSDENEEEKSLMRPKKSPAKKSKISQNGKKPSLRAKIESKVFTDSEEDDDEEKKKKKGKNKDTDATTESEEEPEESQKGTFKCEICCKKFKMSEKSSHMKKVHGSASPKKKKSDDIIDLSSDTSEGEKEEIKKSFDCTLCDKIFEKKLELWKHLRVDHKNTYCNDCQKRFNDLPEHNLKVHKEKWYKCEECDEVLEKGADSKHHLYHQKVLSCPHEDCKNSTVKYRVSTLDSHVEKHHKEMAIVKCLIRNCDKMFMTEDLMQAHLGRNHKGAAGWGLGKKWIPDDYALIIN